MFRQTEFFNVNEFYYCLEKKSSLLKSALLMTNSDHITMVTVGDLSPN